MFSSSFYQKVPDKFHTLRLNFLIFKMKYMVSTYFVEQIRSQMWTALKDLLSVQEWKIYVSVAVLLLSSCCSNDCSNKTNCAESLLPNNQKVIPPRLTNLTQTQCTLRPSCFVCIPLNRTLFAPQADYDFPLYISKSGSAHETFLAFPVFQPQLPHFLLNSLHVT